MWHLFCHDLFLISPSFGASGRDVLPDCGVSWVSSLIFFHVTVV